MTGMRQTDLEARLVRYADLVACRTAFLDTRTPGSTEKENFTIIGPGVSESPEQHVHIREPHGFNIGAARQPFGCVNSQHSHDTAEVFIVHTGRWRLLFGANREDGSLEIGPGDVASVPIHMFRGFEKIDVGTGFLFTILGEDDPGRVTWAPAVFEAAKGHGLSLAKGGVLVDAASGAPAAELESGPDAALVAQLKTPPLDQLARCMVQADRIAANPASPLAGPGVEEAGVIQPVLSGDGFTPGPITGWWRHGFCLRRLRLQSGAYVARHVRAGKIVLLVQEGMLELRFDDRVLHLGAGDTLSLPAHFAHSLRNPSSAVLTLFVVHGTEAPSLPIFG